MHRKHYRRSDKDRRTKNWAFMLVAVGIVIVLVAYIQLLRLPLTASGIPVYLAAFLGLFVSSIGFVSYALHDARSRTRHPGMTDWNPSELVESLTRRDSTADGSQRYQSSTSRRFN